MSEREKVERAISALEAQRAVLGDAVVETATAELREKLRSLAAKAPSEERRQLVTVLFADVSGFTALSEQQDPEEVQALLGRLWRRLDRVILGFHGHIDKHIGDAVMAVWGLTAARESDAIDTVRAGLAMQRELASFREEEQVQLSMRVGVNTGLASISSLESTGESNVIGDTVNLASRLEHAAQVGSVLIGPTTFEHVRERFEVQAQAPLAVKGKAEPVASYVVLSERPRLTRALATGASTLGTPTIGRDEELARILQSFREAEAGSLRWLTLVGDAGVGKSRVVSDAIRSLQRSSQRIDLAVTHAWPETERAPFHLLRELVATRAGIGEGATLDQAHAALERMFRDTLGESLGTEAAAFIGQLVGYERPASPHLRHILRDPTQIRGRAEVLLDSYLAHSAARCPVLLVIEDLHWADRESLGFFARLVARGPAWRMLVLASARPALFERPEGWGIGASGRPLPAHLCIQLGALGSEPAERLTRSLLSRIPTPPTWLIQLCVERGGGNPFFTEEVVHWLVERGVIDTTTVPWSVPAEAPSKSVVPARIELVLHERLDHLGASARAAISAAAVVGATFWNGAVDAVLEHPASSEDWDELERAGLIEAQTFSRVSGERQYEFCHALLREVTYEYTLKKQRRVFHERCANWMTTRGRAPGEQWATNVAWHYERADEFARAAEWYCKAGEQARDADAPDASIERLRRALALLSSGPGSEQLRLRIHEGLGDSLQRKGRHGDALDAYRQMLDAASVAGDASAQARAHNGMSWAESQRGELGRAIENAKRAEAIARSIVETTKSWDATRPPQVELANALHNRAWAHVLLAEPEPAISLAERALTVAREVEATREMALALNVIGVANYYLLGDYDAGARHQEQSLALYRQVGDRWGIACQLNNLGETARARGDFRTAIALDTEALAITREIGNRTLELLCFGNLGVAQVEAEDYETGATTLERVIALADESPDAPFFLSETHRYLAEARLHRGLHDQALDAARRALELGVQSGRADFQGAAWRVLGSCLAQAVAGPPTLCIDGRLVDVAACFAESLKAVEAAGIAREISATCRAWAAFEAGRGDPKRAADLLQIGQEAEASAQTKPRNTLV